MIRSPSEKEFNELYDRACAMQAELSAIGEVLVDAGISVEDMDHHEGVKELVFKLGNAAIERAEAKVERDELAKAARALVEALPKCDQDCGRVATQYSHDADLVACDECAAVNTRAITFGDQWPHAAPLRALLALLERGGRQ